MKKLHKITTQLRDPKSGCPWDKQQSFESIADSTIEEAYEVVEAIENQDYESLKNELGDLLFQVSFHSLIAEERGLFTLDDVLESITEKLIRRHPHVFSGKKINSSEDHTDEWEKIKRKGGKISFTEDSDSKTIPDVVEASD